MNKETKKNEDIISLKNQNGDNLNPPRKIKPRRNVSVQQRKRTNKNFNFNSFLPKAVHQSSNPGIIGLMNEGENSDFINAVIQCFSNIGRFRIELIHLESNKLFNKKISSSFAEVLKNLWVNLKNRTYSPKNFIETIKNNYNFNYKFEEFINFLLNNIHNELNISNNSNLILKKDVQLSYDIYINFNNFQYFKNSYEKLNNSIISREFVGYLGILDFCENCHQNDIITFKTFETLSFHVNEIIEKNQNNLVRIYQCFEYYERKQENMKCRICNSQKYKKFDLLYMPSSLIITLNYGNKTNAKLILEEYLNLPDYVTYNKESPYFYELVGFIVYLENNNQNPNHFIAYCKNSDNCLWYQYDNDKVVRSSFIDVASHMQPSVLFYRYVTT